MAKALLTACAALFIISLHSANAGMLSAVNDEADNALIACIRAHPIPGEKSHTDAAAVADAKLHEHQCEPQVRASLLECRVAGNSQDVCSLAIVVFLNEVISGN
jgi:hypothetical protein